MEAVPRKLVIYKTSLGISPFEEWLDAQDHRIKGLVRTRLKRVEIGNFGVHHGEGSGIWALIFDVGPGYRVYYGLVDNTVVLLLSGGDKKKQSRDIQEAISYWEDFKAHEGRG